MDLTMSAGAELDSERRFGLIAGLGLVLVVVLAVFSNFVALPTIVADSDPVQTQQNLADSKTLFTLGVVGFVAIALLEFAISWALAAFFRPVSSAISWWMGALRLAYAIGAGVLAVQLGSAITSTDGTTTLEAIEQYERNWVIWLALFGAHLVLLGYLAWQSKSVPTWIAGLLLLAGAGYIIDGVATAGSDGYTFNLAVFTFFGEALLVIWLLVVGRKMTRAE